MRKMECQEENLSEELLGENVVACKIMTSSHLIQNMSRTPFRSAKAVPSFIVEGWKPYIKGSLRKKASTEKRLPVKKLHTYGPLRKSDTQNEIRCLLQKAIKIRHLCIDESDNLQTSTPIFGKNLQSNFCKYEIPLKSQRDEIKGSQSYEWGNITMRDIQNAK